MNELLLNALAIAGGLVLLTLGAEFLVRGASRLAAALHISPLIIGLTVVAFGTSAPELAVSVRAALQGVDDVAIGNVVGSNIFNVLFILGASALVVPLVISSQLVRRDVPIMILVSVLLYVMSQDLRVSRLEGLFLAAGIVLYTIWCIRTARGEARATRAEYEREFGLPPADQASLWSWATLINVILVVAGLALLVVGSRYLVGGAVKVASWLGVSDLVISLTIVAAGTSLPELVTSLVAALRNERDIAVGNIVGSNIFNILCVLGFSSLVSPTGVEVDVQAVQLDIPVMIVVAVACLPIFFAGHVIRRWEGAVFLVCYILYTAYLVLGSSDEAPDESGQRIVLFVAAAIAAVTLAISLFQGYCQLARPRSR